MNEQIKKNLRTAVQNFWGAASPEWIALDALLARQPAAIDKEAEYALVKRGDLVEHSHPQYGGGLFATEDCFVDAPLANEASKPAAPEGYKLVPVEPTREMIDAGFKKGTGARHVYAAMLAASPAAPSVEQDERGAFRSWWVRSPHRDKYTIDHPAYLAAEDAWQARAASTSANVAQGAEAIYQIKSGSAWHETAQWVYESTPDVDRRIVYAAQSASGATK